jgi:hypothetical protein
MDRWWKFKMARDQRVVSQHCNEDKVQERGKKKGKA